MSRVGQAIHYIFCIMVFVLAIIYASGAVEASLNDIAFILCMMWTRLITIDD